MPAHATLKWAALSASFALHASAAVAMGAYGHGAASSGEAATTVDLVASPAAVEIPAPETIPEDLPAETAPPAAGHEAAAAAASPVRAAVLRNVDATPESTPAAATNVMTTDEEAPHFAMIVGAAAVAPGGRTAVDGGAAPGAPSDGIADNNGVDQLAELVSGPPPTYPTAARDEGIEADVPLTIVVDASGRVVDVHAIKHLGYGLDEAAADAIRNYRFSPAKREGHGVPVRMRWVVSFRLS